MTSPDAKSDTPRVDAALEWGADVEGKAASLLKLARQLERELNSKTLRVKELAQGWINADRKQERIAATNTLDAEMSDTPRTDEVEMREAFGNWITSAAGREWAIFSDLFKDLRVAINIGLAALVHLNLLQTDKRWNSLEKKLREIENAHSSPEGRKSGEIVWEVYNKTFSALFATEEEAKDYVGSFAASVSGGLHIMPRLIHGNAHSRPEHSSAGLTLTREELLAVIHLADIGIGELARDESPVEESAMEKLSRLAKAKP